MWLHKSKVKPVWDSDKQEQGKGGKGGGKGMSIDGKDLGKKKKEGGESQPGEDGQSQGGDQQGSQSGSEGEEGQEGSGSGAGKSGTEKKAKIEKVSGGRTAGEGMAEDEDTAADITKAIHDMAKKNGLSTGEEGLEGSAKEVLRRASDAGNQMAKSQGLADGMGGFGTNAAKEYIKGLVEIDSFPTILAEIKRRLNKFKALFTDLKTKQKSVATRRFNPGTYNIPGEISVNMPRTIKDEFEIPLLFIAIDTSGSMGPEEMTLGISLVNKAAQHFKTSGSYPGRVVRIYFDDALQLPIVPWTPLTKETSKMNLIEVQGRGGTGFNSLLAGLDDIFVSQINGQDYFIYNEDSIAFKISGAVQVDKNEGKRHNWNIRGKKMADGSIEIDGETFAVADLPYLSSKKEKTSVIKAPLKNVKKKVPFLICITDGGFNSVANIQGSKLYKDTPDNILYVLVGAKQRDYLVPNDAKHVMVLTADEEKNEATFESFLGKMLSEMKD